MVEDHTLHILSLNLRNYLIIIINLFKLYINKIFHNQELKEKSKYVNKIF